MRSAAARCAAEQLRRGAGLALLNAPTVPVSLDHSLALQDLAAKLRPIADAPREQIDAPRFADALVRAETTSGGRDDAGPGLVKATRTRRSGQQAASALADAWQKVTGQAPTPKTLSILVGQWAHETGRGSAMLNYNFGGIKGTGPSGMSAIYKTREGWGDSEVRISDRFRAYASAEEGAADYVGLLARRYPEAVQAAQDGDPRGFVQALKARGYFTGNEASYVKSVTALSSQALAQGFGALGAGEAAGDTIFEIAARAPIATPAAFPQPAGVPAAAESDAATEAPSRAAPALASWGQSSFADEVNRAALLMSALRIAEGEGRRG